MQGALLGVEVLQQGGGHEGLEDLVAGQEVLDEVRGAEVDGDVFRGVEVLAGDSFYADGNK